MLHPRGSNSMSNAAESDTFSDHSPPLTKPQLITDAMIIALFTVMGYAFSYLYELGYCTYFFIPYTYADSSVFGIVHLILIDSWADRILIAGIIVCAVLTWRRIA